MAFLHGNNFHAIISKVRMNAVIHDADARTTVKPNKVKVTLDENVPW
jgi:hypothetical protein